MSESGLCDFLLSARVEEFRMAILLSLTSVGIGDLEVFLPSPPCLLVHTSYAEGEPESSVTYFWQDERTGALHHELVYLEPTPFETALAWAQTHAPTRGVERIHVKHERGKKALVRKPRASPVPGKRVAKKAAAKKVAPKRAAPSEKRASAKTRKTRVQKEA
jgi:hypothetical protein